jgi:hypothetical protein
MDTNLTEALTGIVQSITRRVISTSSATQDISIETILEIIEAILATILQSLYNSTVATTTSFLQRDGLFIYLPILVVTCLGICIALAGKYITGGMAVGLFCTVAVILLLSWFWRQSNLIASADETFYEIRQGLINIFNNIDLYIDESGAVVAR